MATIARFNIALAIRGKSPFTRWMMVLVVLITTALSSAQQTKYHNFSDLTAELHDLVRTHPRIVKLESIGKTFGNRDLWCITLASGEAADKPALLILGGVEGVDLAASEICLHLAQKLARGFGQIDSVSQLLQNVTYYILPRVNPDASEAFFEKVRFERRLNAVPVDEDKDGRFDEDGPDDLNGDGLISLMRVEDPSGDWLADSKDPELMRQADRTKGERGNFRLYAEGLDNDKDGQWNEDIPGGVDFNRNFSYGYAPFSTGAGFYPMSDEESRAVAKFAFAHPNIVVVFAFSSQDNLITPWKTAAREKPVLENSSAPAEREERIRKPMSSIHQDDAPYYAELSEKFIKITGLKDAPAPQKGQGSVAEWAYYHYGRFSFSTLPWWPPKMVNSKTQTDSTRKASSYSVKKPEGKEDPLADQRNLLKWLKSEGLAGFVPWTEVKHPDFPEQKVQVGGFYPYLTINPPADSLEALAAKHSSFLLYLGSTIPKIHIMKSKIEPMHDQVYRLTVQIGNSGYLPTNSAIGLLARWQRKVKVELILQKDQNIASGTKVTLLDPIAGTDAAVELSWLIVAKRGSSVTIQVNSPMAGSTTQTVRLQ